MAAKFQELYAKAMACNAASFAPADKFFRSGTVCMYVCMYV
jgi:hypothetical protein